MPCPLCGNMLPKDVDSCDRCDWTRHGQVEGAEGKASDPFAVFLSVIPGLGHIYKGHRLVGILLVMGIPFAVGLGRAGGDGNRRFRSRIDGILLVRRDDPCVRDRRSRFAGEASARRAILIVIVATVRDRRYRRRQPRDGSPRGSRASRSGTSIRDNAPEICARR